MEPGPSLSPAELHALNGTIPGGGSGFVGDALKSFLDSHGITKEFVSDILEKHGLPPCNCTANQKWLNEVSASHPTIANFGVKLLNALTRK